MNANRQNTTTYINKTFAEAVVEMDGFLIRKSTIETLDFYAFEDYAGKRIVWTPGQLAIMDCILNRSTPDGRNRVQVIASTQYGKSIAVGAAVAIRASTKPEKWGLVAGTTEKARIIMEYVTMFSLTNEIIRTQLSPGTPLDRLRMKRSQDRIVYRRGGEVRVFSAEATRVNETSKALMGFGAPNIIEDESALIPDRLQATVVRMVGGTQNNFLMKIGNPFNNNHFKRTWDNGKYFRIFIDYIQALKEGRYTKAFIDEMREEAMFDILYECKFPEAGLIDSKGWLQLLTEAEVRRAFVKQAYIIGKKKLGADVAGGGRNFSVMVLRAKNVAKKLCKLNEPDTMVYAGIIIHTKKEYGISGGEIFIDRVGIGRGCYDRVHEQEKSAHGIGGADEPTDKKRFVNRRAENFWRLREWILGGGKLIEDEDWLQLAKIKYKVVNSSGKIQIMSKEEMLREGIDSPDVADALQLTFSKSENMDELEEQIAEEQAYRRSNPSSTSSSPGDPYD